ncbi:MAG: type II toxin-antitoxin system RelB/DinJ family antitoxin [Oscillospiraceae bacterium]|nr:type II toxin-antitoxin system RelB/DinJ family antitoxin [Oscillospiraceae bacterium]
MANQTNLNIRTDVDVKATAEQLFERLGLTMSTAVNIFLRQAIRQGGLPFEVKLDVPNETTAAAIREGRAILKDKNAKGYKNIDDLRTALGV